MLASSLVYSPGAASTTSGATSFGYSTYPVQDAAACSSFGFGVPHSMSGSGSFNLSAQPSAQLPAWSLPVSTQTAGNRMHSAPFTPASGLPAGLPNPYGGVNNSRQTNYGSGQQHYSQTAHWSRPQQSGPSNALHQTWQSNQQSLQATPTLPADFDPLASLLPDSEQGSGSSQQIDWNILQQAVGNASQQISPQVSNTGLPVQYSQGLMPVQHQPQFSSAPTLGSQYAATLQNRGPMGLQLSSSLPQSSNLGLARPSAPHTASLMQPQLVLQPAGVPAQPGFPLPGTQAESGAAPAPGLGPLTRALSAPAGEAFLSRAADAVKHLPDKVAIMCGTARGTLLTKRARIIHEGEHIVHTPPCDCVQGLPDHRQPDVKSK